MAKTKVSATELVWIFQQRLRSFDECSSGTYVAIVPSENGWTAVTGTQRRGRPQCPKRIHKVQKQLREIYALTKD
jgi:hypothetical protein